MTRERRASSMRIFGALGAGCDSARPAIIGIPGNDYYLFDDRLAVFLHYAGNGSAAERTSSADPADLRLCRSAFEAVWKVSTPHGDYQPR